METIFSPLNIISTNSTMIILQPGHHIYAENQINNIKEVMDINYWWANRFVRTYHTHSVPGLITFLAWIKVGLFEAIQDT